MKTSATHILKFGGTSLQNQDFIQQSVSIVIERTQTARPFVVVSALEGVTDTLIGMADQIENNDTGNIDTQINHLRQKHLGIFDQLTGGEDHRRERLESLFGELEKTVRLTSDTTEHFRAQKDHILSVGERASALIFAAALSARDIRAEAYEAYQFIKTDSTFGRAKVQPDATRKLVRQFLLESGVIPVVTGFIGSDAQKRITTLGRSGSDYTAGLIAEALEADHLEIWTDVNGVLSADPRWVPTAQPIEELSFTDIGELSAHGAKVIHPKTIRPINDKNTTVLVKNSYNPSHPGTQINNKHQSNGSFKTITITGPFVWFSVKDEYALDLFNSLNNWIAEEPDTEAWSFSRSSAFEPARFLLRESIYDKIKARIDRWADTKGISITPEGDIFKLKKFSNQFEQNEKLTTRIWNLLASNNLRPLHVNRNRGERFISFLFKQSEAQKAARLLNDYLQHNKTTVDLFVAGTGAVGQTLLEQFNLVNQDDFHLRLLGTCNSRNALWDDEGLDLGSSLDWTKSEDTDWNKLTDKLTQPFRHNLIFVDATGSEEVAQLYPTLFEHGVHIVTPSKLANTFEQSFFDKLQELQISNNTSFRYETTVGAGLPVISTINELQESGDTIIEISGVVSGTMTYLFNQLEQGVPFSDAIVEARKLGYAEPDPRDDLSGEDVARKFLTLARTMGLKIERKELEVESLIPEQLQDVDKDSFLDGLQEYNEIWENRIRTAEERNETLRYTGRLKDGKISIGIQSVPKGSPLGQLRGTDNLIQIFSQLYSQTPLVIQGPGAGKKVTAAGVLNDILKTAKSLS